MRFSPQVWVLLFVVVVYIEVMSVLEYLRYLTYNTNAWDLGIIQQSMWTTSHAGLLFYYTAELPWNTTGTFLGVHSGFILFLFVPIYRVLPGAFTLMVIQTAAIGASAFPMYRLTAPRLGGWLAVLLVVLYLTSPAIMAGLFFDFHLEALLPVSALTFWVAWEERRFWLGVVSGALLACTIEYGPIILGVIAFSYVLRRLWDYRRLVFASTKAFWETIGRPLTVTLAAVPITLAAFAAPKILSPYTPPMVAIGPLGGSIGQILLTALTQPGVVVEALSIMLIHKLKFLAGLWWLGLLLWPLAPLEFLPALPWILIALLTTAGPYSTPVGYQYSFLTIPFLFVATAFGIIRARQRTNVVLQQRLGPLPSPPAAPLRADRPISSRVRRWTLPGSKGIRSPAFKVGVFLVLVAVGAQLYYSPLLPWTNIWIQGVHAPDPHDQLLDQELGMIPSSASVSAQPNMFPQVADRLDAYPYYHQGTQYLWVDITNFWFTAPMPPPDPPLIWQQQLAHNVSIPYGAIASAEGTLLFQLGYTALPVLYSPFYTQAPPSTFVTEHSTLVQSAATPLGGYIEPTLSPTNGSLWSGPYTMVPPGQYTLTIWVEAVPGYTGGLRLLTQIDLGQSVLINQTISSSTLGNGWIPITESLAVPHAGSLEVAGRGIGALPAVRFGGFTLSQIETPIIIG